MKLEEEAADPWRECPQHTDAAADCGNRNTQAPVSCRASPREGTRHGGTLIRFPDGSRNKGVRLKSSNGTIRLFMQSLARVMERHGLTRADLAARIDRTPSKIAKLLNPQRSDLRLSTAEKLANAVGCTLTITLVPRVPADDHTLSDAVEKLRSALHSFGAERPIARVFARPTFWAHIGEIITLDRATVRLFLADLGPPFEPRLPDCLQGVTEDLSVIASFLRQQGREDELSHSQKQALENHADAIQRISDALLDEREKLSVP